MSWAQNYFGINDLRKQLDRMERNQEGSARRELWLMATGAEIRAMIVEARDETDNIAADIDRLLAAHDEIPDDVAAELRAHVDRLKAVAAEVPEVDPPTE